MNAGDLIEPAEEVEVKKENTGRGWQDWGVAALSS